MLEEDEQTSRHAGDCTASPDTPVAGDSGTGVPQSSRSSQETGLGSNGVVRSGSLAEEDSGVADSASTDASLSAAACDDVNSDDPWLPLSTRHHPAVHGPTAGSALVSGRVPSVSSHLHCCSGAATHAAARCDALDSERSAARSNFQCRCDEKPLRKMRTADVDRVPSSGDAGLQHNLTEIKEGVPVECFDGAAGDHVAGANPASPADSGPEYSRQSESSRVPNATDDNSSHNICHSKLPSGGLRPARKGSLNGLRRAVRSVLVHSSSLISDHPASLVEGDLHQSHLSSSTSEFSSVPRSTEKSGGGYGERRYLGGGRRSLRGVDSVRHSLTHLLRTGDHHGSSVVGERMAAAGGPPAPERAATPLVGARRTARPALSGLFDVEDDLPEPSSGTGDQQSEDNESDGLTAHLSELDTSDSFYETRLFDALEAGAGDGGFETDSSDDGTYSADSCSDLAPSDDPPTSTASSGSVEVEPRQSETTETSDRSEPDELRAPAVECIGVVLRSAARRRSGSDAKSREHRCTLTAPRPLARVDDITDSSLPHRRWKRLSL